jgi:hypothetical protein
VFGPVVVHICWIVCWMVPPFVNIHCADDLPPAHGLLGKTGDSGSKSGHDWSLSEIEVTGKGQAIAKAGSS